MSTPGPSNEHSSRQPSESLERQVCFSYSSTAALHWLPQLSEREGSNPKIDARPVTSGPACPSGLSLVSHSLLALCAPHNALLPWAPWRGTQLPLQNLCFSGHMLSNRLCLGYPTHPSAPSSQITCLRRKNLQPHSLARSGPQHFFSHWT